MWILVRYDGSIGFAYNDAWFGMKKVWDLKKGIKVLNHKIP